MTLVVCAAAISFPSVCCSFFSFVFLVEFREEYYQECGSKATPPVLSMRPSKLKLNEEKSKHARLSQQNGFGPSIFLQFAEAGKRHSKP